MRRCQRIGCENTLDTLRADAIYCSRTCKREASRSRDLSDGSSAPGFWDGYAQIRRRSRSTRSLTRHKMMRAQRR